MEMKELCIGSNGRAFTDLSPIKNMTRLSDLYAPYCGIDDISVLGGMPDLEYLQLFHNNISDISVLAGLEKLNYLELGMNKIEKIDALSGLKYLTHINLQSNPIPQDALEEFYTPKEEDYFNAVDFVSGCLHPGDPCLCREGHGKECYIVTENNRILSSYVVLR